MYYLNIGTGKACAWQVKAKLCNWELLTTIVKASIAKDGALEPTGS